MQNEEQSFIELFTLGDFYVSDFIHENDEIQRKKYDLTLLLDTKYELVKLKSVPPKDMMWGKYWYRSGINMTMRKELKNIVDSVLTTIPYNQNDIFLDVACNDGTLLGFVPDTFYKVGIDPAEDSFKVESEKVSNLIIQDFFSEEVYNKHLQGKKAKIITIIAMFYDIESPLKFLDEIYQIMDDEGILVLQLSYTPLMLQQLAFDNICHEHIYYYSLSSLQNLLIQKSLNVVDVELNDVNGGSFRVYIRKKDANPNNFKTAPYRDVANFKIQSLLEYEKSLKLNDPKTYSEFYNRINELKNETVEFIKNAKKEGKTIWGYGASTKGNTLLQWYGLDNTLIDAIADKSSYKHGSKTIGTNIPIVSEEEMRKNKPDYLLILPWHFVQEFKKRESNYLESGGKFIIPCPKFEVF
jgi:SAM-dependent methyltransferase